MLVKEKTVLKKLILKTGREKSVLARHPWIFSGAVQEMEPFSNGDVLEVVDSKGNFIGIGYCNKKSQITCRMLAYEKISPEEAIKKSIQEAIYLRQKLFSANTNAYRLIYAEGDFLPGLVVDKFNDVLVVQIGTLGMEKLKPAILKTLKQELNPKWIYEKSQAASRVEEGLKPFCQSLHGREHDDVPILENGLQFLVDVKNGQKTGFFLDQQAMRRLVMEFAHGRKVLNCFSYTGGFSLYALQGGASRCDSVDISEDAIKQTTKHIELNKLHHLNHKETAADVFSFLKQENLDYDFIILDPPAFAKKKTDVSAALRGYKEINRVAMEKLPPGGLLLTASCSYHIDDALFRKMLFGAALDAKKNVRILESHRQSWDHPQSLYCPEGSYLKSYLLYIS